MSSAITSKPKIDLIDHLRSHPFVLAPMAGITDTSFRSMMRQLKCGVVITELVSCHGIEFRSEKTLQLMKFSKDQHPIGIQLFGETPEGLAKAAHVVEEMGADFVDLNFGCPVPKVVKKGAGSAILKDLVQVGKVFKAVKAATNLPVTVKIRTGWDHESRNADQVAQIAYDEGLSWVAIHGRTRAAAYSGQADWDYIADVKAKSSIPIIGNGDIHSAQQAIQRLQESGCDAVMIGRGCLKNPWIFQEAMQLWHEVNGSVAGGRPKAEFSSKGLQEEMAIRDYPELFLALKTAFEANTNEKITLLQLKKFASWYSSGYSGASTFRKTIFQTQSLDLVMDMTVEFFGDLRTIVQADTSQEPFLMGGHG